MRTALLVLLIASHVHAAVLCAKAKPTGDFNSTVKIRTACHDNEVRLDLATVGLGEPHIPVLTYVDSMGVVAGAAVAGSGFLRDVDGYTVTIPLDPSTWTYFAGASVMFSGTQCTGSMFIPNGGSFPYVAPGWADETSGTLYVSTLNGAVVSAFTSILRSGTTADDCANQGGDYRGSGRCCVPQGGSNTVLLPAISMPLTTLQLHPPFHPELR